MNVKNLIIAVLVSVIAIGGVAFAFAQSTRTADVEVRVWESVGDPTRNYISARPAGGSWLTLGTIPIDMSGLSSTGAYRYSDMTLSVPLPDDPSPTSSATPTPATACAHDAVERASHNSLAAVFRREGNDFKREGNAFHIGRDEFLTAGHVVGDATEVRLTGKRSTRRDDTWTVRARVVGGFPSDRGDVALLRVTPDSSSSYATPQPLRPRGWAGALAIGESVAHMRYGETPRWGEVTRIETHSIRLNDNDKSTHRWRVVPEGEGFSRAFTTGPSARGWSGGPVLDECARVVGIHTSYADVDGDNGDRFAAVVVEPSLSRLIADIRAGMATPQAGSSR